MKIAMADSLRNRIESISSCYDTEDNSPSDGNITISYNETEDSIINDTRDNCFHDTRDINRNDAGFTSFHDTGGADVSLIANDRNIHSRNLKRNDDKEDDTKDRDTPADEFDVPIDRGWAWVIVGACFGMHVLVLGGVKSFGVLFVELRDLYHVTARELGMIQGITLTIMLGLGLGANMLAVRFTCRKVVFIGGILSALGFILSAYIPTFDLFYLTYSVITGLGFALSYSPCVVMVGLHFKERRSLANGISISGSGVGSFILPIVIRWMLNEYGLGGCLLLLGGLMLNVCACALLFRPSTSYPRKKYKEQNHHKSTEEEDTDLHHLMDDNKDMGSTKILNSQQEENQPTLINNTDNRQHSKTDTWKKDHCEFSSSEYIPIASLQSISQEELKKIASSLCDKLKCSKCKRNPRKSGSKKGAKLFNWSLLSNPLFLIYASSCALGNFAYPNVFMMLPAHAESNGQDRDSAALLVSIIGITDLIGRLFFGWFSDLKLIPKRYGFVGCMAISAVLNLLVPAMTSYAALVTYAALYGLFAGSYMALISVMLAEALGVEKLSSAYGLVMLLMSLGFLPGPLICGGIRDATSKWDYSFVVCGILALIGSIPPLFEPCARRYVDAKEEKKALNIKLTKVPV